MYKFFRSIKFEMHKWKSIQTYFYLLFEVKLEKPNKFHNCETMLGVLAINILYKIIHEKKRKKNLLFKIMPNWLFNYSLGIYQRSWVVYFIMLVPTNGM
jgi:hypothetical protein